MNSLFIKDYERFTPNKYKALSCLIRMIRNHELRFIYWGRREATAKTGIGRLLFSIIIYQYRRRYGLEINFRNVEGGLRLIHPWNITMNDNAKLGKNVTLFKGCTIGAIDVGLNKGNPTIKDNVIVYANATICGNVTIGANSTIAAGAFVNFNVPENSLVLGNPGVIHKK